MPKWTRNNINMLKKTLQILLIYLFSFILGVSLLVEARTVALVFDDSESMWGEVAGVAGVAGKKSQRKWMYANYAAQALTALLREDDHFIAVRMSQFRADKIKTCNQSDLENIRNNWKPKSKTPYEAVEIAMNEILKSDTLKQARFDEQKQDWLIIMTDGKFGINGQNTINDSDTNKITKKVESFFRNTKGKVRIAFFLIGKEAKGGIIPELWNSISPEQVNILHVKPNEIIDKMFDVAAWISGRDFGNYTDITKEGNLIYFDSLFPIKRIIIFEQVTSGNLTPVDLVKTPDKQRINPKSYYIKNNIESTVPLSAKVTHCIARRIMRDGPYKIQFSDEIENKEIQLLIETAVDFKINLKDKPNANGIYTHCINDKIGVWIHFVKSGTDEPLKLTDKNTKKLHVEATLGKKNEMFLFDKARENFKEVYFDVSKDSQYLSVEAEYPGYLHLKSNLLTIIGEDCIDLIVTLFDENGNILKPDRNDGFYNICRGGLIKAKIQLTEDNIPLQIDSQLQLDAFLDERKILIKRNNNKSQLVEFKANQNFQTLKIIAQWPGYLNKRKLELVNIKAKSCDYGIELSDDEINVVYTYSKKPLPINKSNYLKVNVQGMNRNSNVLKADAIPSGLIITIKDKKLTKNKPEITLSRLKSNDLIPIQIYRNSDYREDRPSTIIISLPDQKVKGKMPKADFIIIPKPRKMSLEPLSWSFSLNKLNEMEPLKINVKINGRNISKQELAEWELTNINKPKRLNMDVNIDKDKSEIHVHPFPFMKTCCLTKTGRSEIKLNLQGPFPLENFDNTIILNIEDVPFIKKCALLIICFFFIPFLILLYIVKCINKPRFIKGAIIRYQRIDERVPRRARTQKLKTNFFTRYLIPWSAERKYIGQITFYAGEGDSIIIKKKNERDRISLNGTPQILPWYSDLEIRIGSILKEERSNGSVDKYEYKKI